jgi:hypothetical protein
MIPVYMALWREILLCKKRFAFHVEQVQPVLRKFLYKNKYKCCRGPWLRRLGTPRYHKLSVCGGSAFR